MKRTMAIALIGGSLITLSAAVRAEPEPRILDDLRIAASALGGGDCARALVAARKVQTSKDFGALSEEKRGAALQIAAYCGTTVGENEVAYRDALTASAYPTSDDQIWRIRLGHELNGERYDAAVTTIEAMTNGRGAALNAIPVDWFERVDTALLKAKSLGLRRRMLAALSADGYHPDEPGVTNENFRYRYAEMLHDAGDRDAALGIARSIDSPSLMIDLSLDPRFRAAFATDPDIRASAERRLIEARAVAARHPDRIDPVNKVASYLRLLGRPRESLAALEAIRPAVDGTASLVDRNEEAVWWWEHLSRAHEMAGEFPATIAALEKGATLNEGGQPNVSQVINLSQAQLDFGHLQDTLKTLAAFVASGRKVSPYGEMQVVITRGCAKARLGTAADAASDIAFARAHVADAPGALTYLLLCVGDQDGAAASLIARLGDSDQRVAALRDLSTFDDPPIVPPTDPDLKNFAAVKQRPDVQAAIAQAGGVRRFNVQEAGF